MIPLFEGFKDERDEMTVDNKASSADMSTWRSADAAVAPLQRMQGSACAGAVSS